MDKSLLKQNEPLSKHSTFRVGGPAKYFAEAASAQEAMDLVAWAQKENLSYFVLGGGSNVLFKDEGFSGLVIKMSGTGVVLEGNEAIAEAGAKWPQVAKAAGGLEEFAYLPGTVGGAIHGNAGCFGKEIADILTRAWLLNEGEVGPEYFDFKYRYSRLKDTGDILLKAAFKVSGKCDEGKMKEILSKRREKQPHGMTAGSFFKNPDGHSAGELIEKCGLKGKTVGGAQISDKHANFILNTGNATANDILELAEIAKKEVKGQFDIKLQEEVRVIG
ncbi:MAG: UDP-N-acetylmuramate dehydrogenase [Patescibacteria group bacterium]|nr:UDP-N-acetylmuramate dehydrogenase [Patescibacteria group bacterium]